MKRSITDRELENLTMANCLMFLSRGGTGDRHHHHHGFEFSSSSPSSSPSRVFECKTCNRQFPSFQALGGHRASHKKPRLMTGDAGSNSSDGSQNTGSPTKPKTHECTICGLEFAIGQALGGHMRRHRAALTGTHHHHQNVVVQGHHPVQTVPLSLTRTSSLQVRPVVKKTTMSTGTRVLCLDLNLTPLENDIKILQLGKTLPNFVDCFL